MRCKLNAHAVISHPQLHAFAAKRGAYFDSAAFRHRMDGINNEIEQNLPHLFPIERYRVESLIKPSHESDLVVIRFLRSKSDN